MSINYTEQAEDLRLILRARVSPERLVRADEHEHGPGECFPACGGCRRVARYGDELAGTSDLSNGLVGRAVEFLGMCVAELLAGPAVVMNCPSWCEEHLMDDGGIALPPLHRRKVPVGDMYVWIEQSDGGVGDPEGPVVEVDYRETVSGPDVRHLALALNLAAELLSIPPAPGGQREVTVVPPVPETVPGPPAYSLEGSYLVRHLRARVSAVELAGTHSHGGSDCHACQRLIQYSAELAGEQPPTNELAGRAAELLGTTVEGLLAESLPVKAPASLCPSWCDGDSLHAWDIDGTFLAHAGRVPTPDLPAWIDVTQSYDGTEFVAVEIEGGREWSSGDVRHLITALSQAVRIKDGGSHV